MLKIIKKLFINLMLAILVAFGLLNVLFANTENLNNVYKKPIYTDKFNFQASIVAENKIIMSWNKFSDFSQESLTYYKIIRSSTNKNPVYPDDGYIYYDTNIELTNYTDNAPQAGINYYRICAITNIKNRYCSNVVTININQEQLKTVETSTEKKITIINLDDNMKTKLDQLIENLKNKLESNKLTNTQKTEKIDKINSALAELKIKKIELSNIIDYLITGLNTLKNKYSDNMQEIEKILNM